MIILKQKKMKYHTKKRKSRTKFYHIAITSGR